MKQPIVSLSQLLEQQPVGQELPRQQPGEVNVGEDFRLTIPERPLHAMAMATAPLPSGWAQNQAEQEWLGGITALTTLLLEQQLESNPAEYGPTPPLGVVLSGPFPVLPNQLLGQSLSQWLLVPEPLAQMLSSGQPLLPGQGQPDGVGVAADLTLIPLSLTDPMARERFCLVLTKTFSLLLLLGEGTAGQIRFQFSFDPDSIHSVWQQLRDRIEAVRPHLLAGIDQVVGWFPPVSPDYRLVTHYSHLLLQQMRPPSTLLAAPSGTADSGINLNTKDRSRPNGQGWSTLRPLASKSYAGSRRSKGSPAGEVESHSPNTDTEFLKAMAHEIRTPLTTIRTLVRSLLKRKDLAEEVAKRLSSIDRECTQQIDRFNLIFTAVELETETTPTIKSPLAAISLHQLFQESIPLWQQQVSRRNLTLTVSIPPHLPRVTSDPIMLNQVLTGLVDRFTHSLPPYSHIQLTVSLAGHQLKLQFQSHPFDHHPSQELGEIDGFLTSPFKALGQLLIFQPETGGVSLNLKATKNLFQALGGKLIVRQRPQAGEVLTVFLPLQDV
ncbi:MAG: sensor histidine kinase [Nodosilinea sp.]